ncbi:uncharacterized protein PAC_09513 [Phialocephala subalpina]|uniref:Uncharacterized protein n=1 Tax=Phialocephala subalpina TaxID=576137 RepID=A0A1L7X3M4_9HELO|nr:uncharacterized protein PAC_09513 [Phialocephala subalpina]
MRYSTESGDPGIDDRISQPRGLGMKVFNVQGEMFDAGKDYPTQDIEFNSTPALELADTKTTKEIFDIRIKYGGDKKELYKQLEARDDTELQKSVRFYSQIAYRFGGYVVKYSLAPTGETQKKLYEKTVKPDSDRTTFSVQFCENLEKRPVEYAGKPWDDEKYPWQTVAKLVVPQQDSHIFTRKTFWEDHMVLNPWHGLKTFQPVSSPNRPRRVVHPASASLRHKHWKERDQHLEHRRNTR